MLKKISKWLDVLLEKIIAFLFFPNPPKRKWFTLLVIIGIAGLCYSIAYKNSLDNLLAYEIKGKIVKSGYSSSSGVGRTSGRSTAFYFKVDGYDAALRMSDILALDHIKGSMFREGNNVEVGVLKKMFDIYRSRTIRLRL